MKTMDHAGGDQADVVVLDTPVLEDGERDVEDEAVLKKRERCHNAQVSLLYVYIDYDINYIPTEMGPKSRHHLFPRGHYRNSCCDNYFWQIR